MDNPLIQCEEHHEMVVTVDHTCGAAVATRTRVIVQLPHALARANDRLDDHQSSFSGGSETS